MLALVTIALFSQIRALSTTVTGSGIEEETQCDFEIRQQKVELLQTGLAKTKRSVTSSSITDGFGIERMGVDSVSEARVHRERLAIKHMSKIGGLFVNELIRHMIIRSTDKFPFDFINEKDSVTPARSNGSFVIAGVRNPCDYYVSLWAYDHGLWWAEEQNDEYDHSIFDYDTADHSNTTKFENWLGLVNSGGNGVMSYRFWQTLVEGEDTYNCWSSNIVSCHETFNDSAVDAGLAAYSPTSNVDCWYRQESLMGDLEICLKKYERLAGVHLPWEVFEEYKSSTVNPSDHKSCEFYYSKGSTVTSVRSIDKHIFDKFGYNSCCDSAVNPSLWGN